MPNRWEVNYHLNPFEPNARRDPDHDHLSKIGEFHNHARPHDEDADNDGIDDGDEVNSFHLDPTNPDQNANGVPDGDQNRDGDCIDNEDEDDVREACRFDDDDSDSDGIDDEDENELGTSVHDADSGNDGVDDGNEDLDGNDVNEEDEDDGAADNCVVEEQARTMTISSLRSWPTTPHRDC
jgi:hypothetical protein